MKAKKWPSCAQERLQDEVSKMKSGQVAPKKVRDPSMKAKKWPSCAQERLQDEVSKLEAPA